MLSLFGHVWLFGTPRTAARQAPLSMGFDGQEYWSGLPCPPPVLFIYFYVSRYPWIIYMTSILFFSLYTWYQTKHNKRCTYLCFAFCFWMFSLVLTQIRGLSFIFYKNVCSNNFQIQNLCVCYCWGFIPPPLSLSLSLMIPCFLVISCELTSLQGSLGALAGLGWRLFPLHPRPAFVSVRWPGQY